MSRARRRAEGSPERVNVYALDMTEQRKLEAQFAQGQKMQAVGQLAGGVAHDFNNVLTAIIGFSDLLLLKHKPGDPSFADLMSIKQSANRAAGLTRQLLAFSRRQTLRPQILEVPTQYRRPDGAAEAADRRADHAACRPRRRTSGR